MIIRTLAYVCDKCKTGIAMVKAQELLNLPAGWAFEAPTYSYGSEQEKHICNRCIEKKEIKEVFK
jgi:hypothetical protein